MEIFTRKSRVYRHLVLAGLWYAIVVYKVTSGIPLGPPDALFLLAGMSFSFLFYVEWKRPYVVIKDGVFSQGLFVKSSIKLDEIHEWQNRSGVLYLAGAKHKVKVLPSRISQSDMEQIYEVLKGDKSEGKAEFHKDYNL
tara:strand:+ start:3559 stop:3975 length:417 start_codon:yes stop_codon:yes gene_type:complete